MLSASKEERAGRSECKTFFIVCFKSGNVDWSKLNQNVKVKDKDTTSTTFDCRVLQYLFFLS